MENKELLVQKERPGIAIFTLNRAEKRNSLTISLLESLIQAFEGLKFPEQRVVILQGAGPVFCSGLDLHEVQQEDKRDHIFRHIAHLLKLMTSAPQIIISAIQGAAFAGALALVSASDITIAAENTQFGLQETRRGLVAALIIALLMRQVRMRDLKEMTLTGEPINEKRAFEMGWISRIVPGEELLEASVNIAQSVLKGAPDATVRTKQFFHELESAQLDEGFQKALILHAATGHTKEVKEGIESFLEKRLPYWDKQ